ncbi:MAG: putative immunity protein, partial [Mycobacterium sp.]
MSTIAQQIAHLAPCDPAVRWLADRTDMQQSWDDCPRGDWLLWLLERAGADRKQTVLAACDCARTALQHVPDGEDRPRLAIEAAEGWARGEVSRDDVRMAARAAYAAAYAADADADAARAAAYATDAAYAAAYA